jgi:glycosyltransferase involved in cell wall biosynthesis
MNEDLVSVIMPTYNAGEYLSASIDSILNQTYKHLELLITDDGSTDSSTLRILEEYAGRDARIKVEHLKGNNGPGVARNKSIERAKGRYIAFCDSDDRWFPEKLERQIALMREKRCALSCTSYVTCNDSDQETGVVIAPETITFNMLKHDNKVGCSTAMYDTKLLGGKVFMPVIRKRQDWALFLTILRKSSPAYTVTEPMAYYRQRNHSVSSNKMSLIKYNVKIYETILGYPKWKAYPYFLFVFLPTYYLKIQKRKRDSRKYLACQHDSQNCQAGQHS